MKICFPKSKPIVIAYPTYRNFDNDKKVMVNLNKEIETWSFYLEKKIKLINSYIYVARLWINTHLVHKVTWELIVSHSSMQTKAILLNICFKTMSTSFCYATWKIDIKLCRVTLKFFVCLNIIIVKFGNLWKMFRTFLAYINMSLLSFFLRLEREFVKPYKYFWVLLKKDLINMQIHEDREIQNSL